MQGDSQRNPRVLYNLLFQASAAAMQELADDPKHLGAQIGFLSILHVHCVIPTAACPLTTPDG